MIRVIIIEVRLDLGITGLKLTSSRDPDSPIFECLGSLKTINKSKQKLFKSFISNHEQKNYNILGMSKSTHDMFNDY